MEISRPTIFNFMCTTPLKLILSALYARNDRRGRIWACRVCTLKRCIIRVYLLSSCGVGPTRPRAHIFLPICLLSRDLWRNGFPPSPPGYSHVRGPRDDVRSHVIAKTEFSLSYVSPHPQICLCMGGGGVSVGPAVCYGLGTISMKED